MHQVTVSSIIIAILAFIVINFYVFSSIVNLDSFFYIFLILSILTDGLFVLIHLPRKGAKHNEVSFDPNKVTVVIASYNGQDIIAETVKQALVHVPGDQIIVMSDASTDKTAEVAEAAGARVIVNRVNLHKAGTISAAMKHVSTPYVLILDDDTLIGKTFIPTSLMDEGYTAVAFNVMPLAEKTIINELQQFEYRNSMEIGKGLRAKVGAIGNISGAIGLYRTSDLIRQATMHSGQFAGEDEQRTLLAHMHGTGKGITYTDSLVMTKAPDTYRTLFNQRAFSWSLSVPELFTLYWRVLLSTRYHYLLKAEKAYQMYIYLTDPLRILFFWTLILKPNHLLVTYGFYFILNIIIWLKMGRKDTLRSIILSPIYTLGLMIARFIGHFYWLRVKLIYLLNRNHSTVTGRPLLAEYGFVFSVLAISWIYSVNHFTSDLNLLNKINSQRLENSTTSFKYDKLNSFESSRTIAPAPLEADYVIVAIEKGDTQRALAHKAVEQYLMTEPELRLTDDQRSVVNATLATKIAPQDLAHPFSSVRVKKLDIAQSIQTALAQGEPR